VKSEANFSIPYWMLIILAIFYILTANLGRAIPFYDTIDDILLTAMLLLGALKVTTESYNRINLMLLIITSTLMYIVILSSVYNDIKLTPAIQFMFIISRPLIIAFFIRVFRINVDSLFRSILKISRFILYSNLPMILYNLVKYNLRIILEAEYRDSIAGFFPFTNNDSLVIVYLLLFYNDFYDYFFLNKKKFMFLVFDSFLILTTLSLKYIFLTIGTMMLIFILKSQRKMLITFTFLVILAAPIYILMPILKQYSNTVSHIPIFNIVAPILSGSISEHNIILGSGPGSFTSPIALRSNSNLSLKYIKPYYLYFSNVAITGTFTRVTSSFSTLLGETGILGLFVYIIFIILMLKNVYSKMHSSLICLAGFFAGINCLVLGIIFDFWFWGIDIFLLILANFGLREKKCSN